MREHVEGLTVYYLVRFNRRTGKIDTTMDAYGKGLLCMWALHNTTKAKDTIIFDENGIVAVYYEGTGDFPKAIKGDGVDHIDNYCEGLLEAVKQA